MSTDPTLNAVEPPPDSAHRTPHLRLDSAASMVQWTQSARSGIHGLSPAGNTIHTQHLTDISISISHSGVVGEMAEHLAKIKHYNALVTQCIADVGAEIRQEEHRLAEHFRNQSPSPASPLSGPLLSKRESGASVPSMRSPAASPNPASQS